MIQVMHDITCRTGYILASFLQYTAILLTNPIIKIGLASKSFFLQIFEITNLKIINKSSTESKYIPIMSLLVIQN